MTYKQSFFSNSLVLLIFMLQYSCANRVAPAGGEKDAEAPKVQEQTPSNRTVNFSDDGFVLRFDEFVQLQDPNTQVLISPLMLKRPEFKLKGKKLIVKFQEPLKENTTYTFNFGESIKDITESNAMTNFEYAFSTGKYLDSLSIKGRVVDAQFRDAQKDVLIAAYPFGIDSLFTTTPPSFITRTDEDGKFQLNNLPANNYQLIGLIDKNNNYFYDQPNEDIAFFPYEISLNDSSLQKYELQLFNEGFDTPKMTDKRNREYGHLEMFFSKEQDSITIVNINDSLATADFRVEKTNGNDTLHIWYRNITEFSPLSFVLKNDSSILDTIKFKKTIKESTLNAVKFTSNIRTGRGQNAKMDLKRAAWIQFNHPIEVFNKDKIVFMEDSVNLNLDDYLRFDDYITRKLIIDYDWKPETDYVLVLPDSTIIDFYGEYNDEIAINLTTYEKRKYGTLILNLTGFDDTKNYVLQLYDGKKKLKKSYKMASKNILLDYLDATKYKIMVLEDDNDNGQWDAGNYGEKKQSERTHTMEKMIDVKANWDTEVELSVN
ncbi:MAG: Ig-like domain-containing protein [Chitinophagales bacterium]